jgi:hypothetical protein
MGNRLGFVRAYKEGRPVQLDNAPVIQTWIGFVFEPSPQKRAWDFNGARDFLSQYRESLPHIEAIFDETVQVQEITRTRQEIIERKVGLNRTRTRNEDETRWLQLSDDRLVSPARKPALNSQGMFSEPGTHLLIGPGPFKGMGVPMVIFWPRSQDMSLELLLTLPGRPFQVIVLERMDEDFRLVQPRRIGGRIPGSPPALTPIEILARVACYVTWPAVLDQEDAE